MVQSDLKVQCMNVYAFTTTATCRIILLQSMIQLVVDCDPGLGYDTASDGYRIDRLNVSFTQPVSISPDEEAID
jgi:hypothetical protein